MAVRARAGGGDGRHGTGVVLCGAGWAGAGDGRRRHRRQLAVDQPLASQGGDHQGPRRAEAAAAVASGGADVVAPKARAK